MTARIRRALRNPYVHALNHPHGRLIPQRPAYAVDMQAVIETAAAGDVDAVAALMFNDLEPVVLRRHALLSDVRSALNEAGALGVILCGSGPTMAGLARDEAHARAMAAQVPSAVAVSGPG